MSDKNADFNAMLTPRAGDYYVAFWYLAGENCDFLAILLRPEGATDLRCDYRFRYYRDDRVFDSQDERSEFRCNFTDTTEDRAIQLVDDTIIGTLVRKGFCGSRLSWVVRKRSWRRVVKGDGAAFLKKLQELPFVHTARADTVTGMSLGAKPKGEGN